MPSSAASATGSCTCGRRTAPCWPPRASRASCGSGPRSIGRRSCGRWGSSNGDHVMESRWGLTVPLSGAGFAEQREWIEELPDLGFTDLWSAEVDGVDAFTPLLLAAQWAPSMRLGTAIVPVYTRGPALLAQSAAAMGIAAPGRFVLGIGSSSNVIVERWNGIEFTKPYERVRDTLRFLQDSMGGAKVTETYDTFEV